MFARLEITVAENTIWLSFFDAISSPYTIGTKWKFPSFLRDKVVPTTTNRWAAAWAASLHWRIIYGLSTLSLSLHTRSLWPCLIWTYNLVVSLWVERSLVSGLGSTASKHGQLYFIYSSLFLLFEPLHSYSSDPLLLLLRNPFLYPSQRNDDRISKCLILKKKGFSDDVYLFLVEGNWLQNRFHVLIIPLMATHCIPVCLIQ